MKIFSIVKKPYLTTHLQKPGSGKIRKISLFPGEGIGKEVTESLLKINSVLNPPISFDIEEDFSFNKTDYKKNKVILKGPRIANSNDGVDSTEEHTRLAKELGLYANVVHAFTIPEIKTRHKNLDIVVIRENTEGEYSGLEHEVYPGVIESIKVITKDASIRIAEYAFEYASMMKRKKVTVVHKANIMKFCDGQFLDAIRQVSKAYPNIEFQEMIIDNCCMQLISNPNQFDVMVLPNLYGNIVANVCLGIIGGPGITPSGMVGNEYALFDVAGRHPAKDIEGKGIANPTGFLLSYSMLLRHVGFGKYAEILDDAVYNTIKQNKVRTPDIGGTASSVEYTKEIIKNIKI